LCARIGRQFCLFLPPNCSPRFHLSLYVRSYFVLNFR
jgi:hypothetical protein